MLVLTAIVENELLSAMTSRSPSLMFMGVASAWGFDVQTKSPCIERKCIAGFLMSSVRLLRLSCSKRSKNASISADRLAFNPLNFCFNVIVLWPDDRQFGSLACLRRIAKWQTVIVFEQLPIVHISSPRHPPGKEDGISLIAPHRVTLCLMMLLWLARPRIGQAAGSRHTHGVDIVDDNGQKVILRGEGLGNWLVPEGYVCFGNGADRPRRNQQLVSDLIGPQSAETFWQEYRRQYITEKDIQRIAELGFNSVRPAPNGRLFMSEGDDAAFLDRRL